MHKEPKTWQKPNYIISTHLSLLQIPRIHGFLSKEAYWCLNIPLTVVENAIKNSLCFGVYHQTDNGLTQVGFARIVTDHATFAWLCDVYIETQFRGQGLSKWLVECVLSHPALKGLRRICLATKDAHSLYKKYGFAVTQTPENWMEIKNNDIYAKAE